MDWPEPFYTQAKDPSDEEKTFDPLIIDPVTLPGGEVFCASDRFFKACIPFGNAILSRYPMPVPDRQLDPLPPSGVEQGKEYRQLMRVRIVVEGVEFHIYNTHLASQPGRGTEAGLQAREDQAQVILGRVGADRTAATTPFPRDHDL